ncbi:MAG: hypothetical protein JWO35_260 [Candidatus Saccharibacteria bacterium]|nr:hypothetical protein [Candidatus Saccharibacteria bacterium]
MSKPKQHFTIAAENIARPVNREKVQNRLITVTNGTNNARFSLYASFNGVAAPAEQVAAPAPEAESAAPATPSDSVQVVGMLERTEQRQLSEQEQKLAAAEHATAEAYNEGHNYGTLA